MTLTKEQVLKLPSTEAVVLALDNERAAAAINVSPGTLSNWRGEGRGPRYLKTSSARNGHVLYRIADLEAWLEEQMIGGGADE